MKIDFPARKYKVKTDCVDEQILFIYCFGKIAGLEKERIDAHIKTCNACLLKIREFATIEAQLKRKNDVEG